MIRTLAFLPLMLAAGAALAQPPQLTQAQRAHVAALGQALARCHGLNAQRLARTPMAAAQIVDRTLAACAAREAPIRAEVVRFYGAANAPRVIAAQRAHYRQVIGQMVAQARARG
jgi:hypothetical protein